MTTSLLLFWTAASWASQGNAPAATSDPNSQSAAGGKNDQSTMSASSTQDKEGKEENPASAPMTPLSGADEFRPGSSGPARSYLLPAFQWTGYADMSGNRTANGSKLLTQSTYLGSLTLQRARKRSQTNLDYAGGGIFYNRRFRIVGDTRPSAAAMFHQFGLAEAVRWRRWRASLEDRFLYLPESPFGFSGFGGLQSFGGGLGGGALGNTPFLNPAFQPNQTILTGASRRISNSVATQVQYDAGKRSAITASGVFGTLQFLDPGFIDSNFWILLAGYNFAATRRDSLALIYTHSLFQLGSRNRELLNRGFYVAYGHRISGKLSLSLSAGPLLNEFAQPLGGAVRRSFLSTYDSLIYQGRRGYADVSFVRTTTGGSGVLLGAESDWAQLTVSRQLLRKLSGSVHAGHAYNQSLTRESPLNRRSKFEAWEGGVSLSHEFGPTMSIYVNYDVQRQTSNSTLCFGSNCGASFFRQVGGMGLSWHPRPIRID